MPGNYRTVELRGSRLRTKSIRAIELDRGNKFFIDGNHKDFWSMTASPRGFGWIKKIITWAQFSDVHS